MNKKGTSMTKEEEYMKLQDHQLLVKILIQLEELNNKNKIEQRGKNEQIDSIKRA